MTKIYSWMQENDLPNWIGLLFSLIIWPVVIYFWTRRKISFIDNLTVSTEPGEISIHGRPNIPALKIVFTNNTNSTIVLTNPKIKNNNSHFNIHIDSARDFNTTYYELKFHDGIEKFNLDFKVLRTGEKAFTAIGLTKSPSEEFYKDRPILLRRIFKYPKYFILQYTAQVDKRSYQVKSIY